MIRMKATKELSYRTRRLLADGTAEFVSRLMPGDIFEVNRTRDVRVLRATRKAEEIRQPAKVPPPPPEVAAKIEAAIAPPPVEPGAMSTADGGLMPGELAQARADYEAAFGKRPFHGWSAEVLRQKIAEKAGA